MFGSYFPHEHLIREISSPLFEVGQSYVAISDDRKTLAPLRGNAGAVLGLGIYVFGNPEKVTSFIDWAKTSLSHEKPDTAVTTAIEEDEESDFLDVSNQVLELNGITTAAASLPTRPRLLHMRGSLALDVNRLVHIRARFPGQIVQLLTIEEQADSIFRSSESQTVTELHG